jgi:Bifunctional DNA primase/polymerase, N-terminal
MNKGGRLNQTPDTARSSSSIELPLYRNARQPNHPGRVRRSVISDGRGVAMVFRDWQPRYAAYCIATFPVRVGDGGKVPAIRGWQLIGLRGSAKLAQTKDADAFGFCPGSRSRLTILDVDTGNERALADALARHGSTPIIVRSGSGNYQAWYRWDGEERLIRPDPDKPIDILGSGFVVAPPSRGIKSNYEFIEGGLDDLNRLPRLRNLPLNNKGEATLPSNETIGEGYRNESLWRLCMKNADHCDDFEALVDVARTRNESFLPPLTDEEVVKIANSAWGYAQRGKNRFGRPGVFFSAEEANRLITRDPDQFVLLAFLRANNGPDSNFMVANGLAKKFGWGLGRLRAARRGLVGTNIKMVKRPSSINGPALYRWLA